MIFNELYWGVAVGDGADQRLAKGDRLSPKLFVRKSDAMRFKRELETHAGATSRVVKLACQFEILDRRIRRIR